MLRDWTLTWQTQKDFPSEKSACGGHSIRACQGCKVTKLFRIVVVTVSFIGGGTAVPESVRPSTVGAAPLTSAREAAGGTH